MHRQSYAAESQPRQAPARKDKKPGWFQRLVTMIHEEPIKDEQPYTPPAQEPRSQSRQPRRQTAYEQENRKIAFEEESRRGKEDEDEDEDNDEIGYRKGPIARDSVYRNDANRSSTKPNRKVVSFYDEATSDLGKKRSSRISTADPRHHDLIDSNRPQSN